MREKEYAVDSTRGSSLINPMNYKGDVLVQVWIDSRVLATVTRWMDEKGNYPRFMSQAVRRPLEVLVEFLVNNGEVKMTDDTAEARKFLIRRFNVALNRGGRGEKNVLHNITLSDRRDELSKRIRSNVKADDISKPKMDRVDEIITEAERKYRELYPDEK